MSSKVLMIYTGGTIGMLPREKGNPLSPLAPAEWNQLVDFVPALRQMTEIRPDLHAMKLIDSSDMHPGYWIDIARVIGEKYKDYDGFVILHGTDTMTYTATALSFLLDNLDKPVIITGSQISISRPRNDAVQNLVASLIFAAAKEYGLPVIPEVCICFDKILLRGNRSRKVSSSEYAGFDTPNYPHLAQVGEHIKVNTKAIRRPSDKGFFNHEALEQNVMLFDIFPGISPKMLRSVFDIEGLKGIVFRTFGAGNAPTNENFLREIEYAVTKKNLAIVNITQCTQGMVEMGLYDASATLSRIGVISGLDMTPEAALVKMMFLLGQGYDQDTLKAQMQKDLRGEQSVNTFNLSYEHGAAGPVAKLPAKQIPAGFDRDKIEKAHIRLDGVTLPKGTSEGKIELAVFMNFPAANQNTDVHIAQCLGVLEKGYAGEPVNMILDVTNKLIQIIDPDRPVQVSIVSRGEHEVRWDGAFISIFTSVDV
jgi:L-asparaginase